MFKLIKQWLKNRRSRKEGQYEQELYEMLVNPRSYRNSWEKDTRKAGRL